MDGSQLLRVAVLASILKTCSVLALSESVAPTTLQADALSNHTVRAGHRQSVHLRREIQVVGDSEWAQHGAGFVAVAEKQVREPEDTTTPKIERPPALAPEDANDKLEADGIIEVYHPAKDASQVVRLEEESMECMMDTPVWQCMEKFGSYGVRRLFTDTTDDFEKLRFWNKDWMSNAEVQKRKFYDMVWPGSHDSGCYGFDEAVAGNNDSVTSVRGALTQHLDTFTQLKMGVRALDIQVATGITNGELYTANGFLMTPLSTFLTDIASFLEQHKYEVIVLQARKADVWNGITHQHIQTLRNEETDPTYIPGETVHKGVWAIIGNHLATHEALKRLKGDPTNPTMEDCIAAGIRVFYYWEGQQVLCTDHSTCSNTPGWQRGNLGKPFAFGPPMAAGARSNLATAMSSNDLYLEPACVLGSGASLGSGNPFQLLMNVKQFSLALMDHAKQNRPECFASDGNIPDLHTPTLLYKADAYVSPHTTSEGMYKKIFIGVKEVFTKGEAMTLQSEGERTNYLLLMWLLRKNWRPLYTKLNILSSDYVAPAVVQRIIEANQNTNDCGYAIHCKDSGSCWAMTRLDEDGSTCLDEGDVLEILRAHSEGDGIKTWVIILAIFVGGFICKVCCCGLTCFLCGNKPYPVLTRKDGFGIMWWKRQPRLPTKEVEKEVPAEAEAEAEAEGEEEADEDEGEEDEDADGNQADKESEKKSEQAQGTAQF